MRRAFTLIELVLTMVILSIVAYIATGLIAKTYLSYNRVNTLHKANIKVELTLNNIANRLSNAIIGTIVKRKSVTDSSIESIDAAPNEYEVLEWVGNDIDGFEAQAQKNNIGSATKLQPAWSGFCNIKASSQTQIFTPGSDLAFENIIIRNLSEGKVVALKNIAIFFPGNYNYRNIGYLNTGGGLSGVGIISGYSVANPNNPYFTLKYPLPRITEHYKLAWSAYAVVPTNCGANGCNLELRYNFRPWNGEYYNSRTTKKSLLATNVTVFKTYARENRVHIKLCVKENIGVNATTSICKEKVVFRWESLEMASLWW